MPWRPIQNATAGFLSLLNIKNVGKNPDTLLESVQPIVNMEPWWLRGAVSAVLPGATIVATGGSQNLTFASPAEGSWLYVDQFQLELVMPVFVAGNNVRVVVTDLVSGITFWSTDFGVKANVPDVFAANERAVVRISKLWVPPGKVLQAQWNATAGDQLIFGDLMGHNVRL
jgi:hypothetical protein